MKNLKRIAIGACVLLILAALFDWCAGTINEKFYFGAKYGLYKHQIYALEESNDEVLIMGSSRASHHYVTQMFEESLNMRCYNVGSDGLCIYYHYAILASRIHRGVLPKMVILDVISSDVENEMSGFTLETVLDRLAPHYGQIPAIDSLFAINGPKDQFKILSKAYRYNSKIVQAIKCKYVKSDDYKGYLPLFGDMGNISEHIDYDHVFVVDSNKVTYLRKFITTCKNNGIQLIICYSPMYGSVSASVDVVKSLAEQYLIPFLDYGKIEQFHNTKLFKDQSHLNDIGAHQYTQCIIKEILHLNTKHKDNVTNERI